MGSALKFIIKQNSSSLNGKNIGILIKSTATAFNIVEIVSIYALFEIRDALALKKRNYNGDPIVEVPGHICKTALIGRSILMTKKGNKESRSVMPIV